MANVIANRGQLKPIRILRQSTDDSPNKLTNTPIYSEQTATKLMEMMRSTVHGGTATQTFGRGRYREIAREVGGKTGTLTGRTPAGLTSLFIGLYPVSAPKIAVSSVVVLEDRFHFKAPQLAAEAILSWKQQTERTRQTLR
jgi:cell division protein FtsI/penicillin-binding protein 2